MAQTSRSASVDDKRGCVLSGLCRFQWCWSASDESPYRLRPTLQTTSCDITLGVRRQMDGLAALKLVPVRAIRSFADRCVLAQCLSRPLAHKGLPDNGGSLPARNSDNNLHRCRPNGSQYRPLVKLRRTCQRCLGQISGLKRAWRES